MIVLQVRGAVFISTEKSSQSQVIREFQDVFQTSWSDRIATWFFSIFAIIKDHHIPIDLIVGTSAGSIIGALYADNPQAALLKEKIIREKENGTFPGGDGEVAPIEIPRDKAGRVDWKEWTKRQQDAGKFKV